MKFEEVLPTLREGKKIRRKDIVWQNYYGFLFISETENEIFSDNVWDCDYAITKEDLNADDWEIVKEKEKKKKETKKVKLRDLTEEQYIKWQDESCDEYDCSNCPFRCIECNKTFWVSCKDMYSDQFLDQEIEVEE